MENQTKSGSKPVIQFIKFTLFSISAGAIQAISFALLHEVVACKYWIAYLTALILSVLWNFTLNRNFTFKSSNNIPIAMIKVAIYYLIFTPLSTWLGDYFTDSVGVNAYIVLAITMLTNFITEFLYDKYFVFTKQKEN